MKTLIAIPCMEQVPTQFMQSLLGLQQAGEAQVALTMSSLIYDARNTLAKKAVNEGYDRVLWLDSDMYFAPDIMERLSADLDAGYEFVSGLYFTRRAPIKPVVYKQVGMTQQEDGDSGIQPVAVPYDDYPRNSIFPCEGVGFGGCMMTTGLLKDVIEKYGLPFSPVLGFGEDLSFCGRVIALGREIWCDSSIKLGHIYSDVMNEEKYLKNNEKWISVNDRLPEIDKLDYDWMLGVVTGRYGSIEYKGAVEMVSYSPEDGWWMPAYPEYSHVNVTHWMPCPEAPENTI